MKTDLTEANGGNRGQRPEGRRPPSGLLCFLGLLLCNPGFAASLAIGPTGTGDGTDWSNPLPWASTTLQRGNTYYMKGGVTYASKTLNTAISGSTLITVKKATIADHGPSTGWSDPFAAQAEITGSLSITTSFWLVDGVERDENDWFDATAYGIKIQHNGNWTHLSVANGSTQVRDVTCANIGIVAQVGSLPSYPSGGPPNAISTQTDDNATLLSNSNLVFRRILVRGSNNPFFTRQCNGPVVEYCASELTCGQGGTGWHGETFNRFFLNYNAGVVRYCIARDQYDGSSGYPAGGGTAIVALSSSPNGEVYGNLFYRFLVSDGVVAMVNGSADNTKVFNNTFADGATILGSLVRGEDSEISPGTVCSNNLSYNMTGPWGANVYYQVVNGNNTVATSNMFVNAGAGDYRLSTNTVAGTTLASPYDTDLLGNTRGGANDWSRGAYQFDGEAPPPDTNAPTVTLTAPTNGSSHTNNVTLTATASDDVQVSGVEFFVDGTLYYDDTVSPYTTVATMANGSRTVYARARDSANYTYSATNTITVTNILPSLGAYWKLDGNGNDELGTNDLISGTVTYVAGKIANAASFNGSTHYLSAPNSPELDINTNRMSIAAWVKPTDTATWQQFVAKNYTSYGSPFFSWHIFARDDGDVWMPCFQLNSTFMAGTTNVNYGEWTHIAATYDGVYLKLYVNGALQTQLAQTGNVNSYAATLTLGTDYRSASSDEKLSGLLDEVRLYGEALTPTTIQQLYTLGTFTGLRVANLRVRGQ